MPEKTDAEDFFGPVIFRYTTEDAVSDGILVPTGYVRVGAEEWPVYFTHTLFDGYEDEQKRTELVNHGLELLWKPDEEDSDYMRLRVIEKNSIWVVAEPGKITYMRPEDY